MCASDELKMDTPNIARYSSVSTTSTLIGSDDGVSSPVAAKAALQLLPGVVQTADNKQWIDLDLISPKLLRELSARYDPAADDGKSSLAKRAAKFKAWTRQTKLGFDVRLRRKLDSDRDEITDIRLTREPYEALGEKLELVSEMPEQNIFEMPDTSVPAELPAVKFETDNPEPAEVSAEEAPPRYEPAASSVSSQRPRLQVQTADIVNQNSSHSRSPSGSSILTTPTEGLSTEREGTRDSVLGENGAEAPAPVAAKNSVSNGTDGDADENDSQSKTDTSEELRALLTALKEQLASQAAGPKVEKDNFDRLKIAQATRYETETDAEPPSPSDSKAYRASLRPAQARRRKISKPKMGTQKSPLRKPSVTKWEPTGSVDTLPRRGTFLKRMADPIGPEAAWTAILNSQAQMLGSEHPLCFLARHSQAMSRVSQHKDCSPDVLDALRESEKVAKQTLGMHPLVEAFTADLRTLENLILPERPSPVEHQQRRSPVVTPETPPMPASPQSSHAETSNVPQTYEYTNVPRQDDSGNPDFHPSPALEDMAQQFAAIPIIETSFYDNGHFTDSQPKTEREPLWTISRPPPRPRNGVSVLAGQILAGMTSSMRQGLSWLEHEYGSEPQVEPGKVRVRWTCPCGKELFDDYTERRPGAARELEAYLNRSRPKTRTGGGTPTTPSSTGSRSFNGSLNSSVGGSLSTQTSWSSISQNSVGGSNSGTKRSQTAASLPPYSPFTPLSEPPWLLTCANEERHTPKVAHLDMSPHKITSDRDLAKALREHYFDINRKWWKRLRLRGLTTIEFVQFECHQNRFADIRKCPDMPPHGNPYTFEPGELMPPVGSQYLLHLFKHPEEYDSELITYLRAPKRNGRLSLGVGWGINMVEGFQADRVWMLVNITFSFISLVFAVAWACARNDIQGAFGVAQWICMLAVFAGGWIQAYIG